MSSALSHTPGPISPASEPASGAAAAELAPVIVQPPRMEGATRNGAAGRAGPRKRKTLYERAESFISRLAAKSNFWHGVTSLIWLPFAARSGIKMEKTKDGKSAFTAILPFKRFNRNWYNAMAGAALLGNAEIAGGMYVFGVCGGEYTVVCKHLEYKFMRPCFGPAIYRCVPRENVEELVAKGGEFNVTCDMDVVQQIVKPGDREKRVGKVEVTFHVTPKAHHKKKAERKRGAKSEAAGEV